jgi:hypothetical protein
MKQPALALSVALAALPLSACRFANDNLVFATNASFGVDVDVAPNTVSIGYSRDEVSVGPITKEGEVLQVMASFSAGANILDSLFRAGISQSFAVGNAAYVLSKYFLVNANPALPDGGASIVESTQLFTHSSATAARGARAEETCYFFGTATNFGLKIGVGESGVSLTGIDSLSLGYKRKELAFVPITEFDTNGTTTGGEVQVVPPLIATLVANAAAGQGGSASPSLRASQLYATGHAATYLAASPGIRASIGKPFVDEHGAKSLDTLRKDAEEARKAVDVQVNAAQERSAVSREIWALVDGLQDDRLADAREAFVNSGLAAADAPTLVSFDTVDTDERRKALKRMSVPGSGDERLAQLIAARDALAALVAQ